VDAINIDASLRTPTNTSMAALRNASPSFSVYPSVVLRSFVGGV
jgi:hypothetical protein